VLEAEVKLALSPAEARALGDRLAEAGAQLLGEHMQTDVYFRHPVRDLASSDEALRLRVDGERLLVTYKGPKLDPPRKTREEIEFPLLTDLAHAKALLERLGFTSAATVRKRRREFRLPGEPGGHDGVVVSLDQVDELGCFCEIEVQTATVEHGRSVLANALGRLGLEAKSPIAESYLELLLARNAASG